MDHSGAGMSVSAMPLPSGIVAATASRLWLPSSANAPIRPITPANMAQKKSTLTAEENLCLVVDPWIARIRQERRSDLATD